MSVYTHKYPEIELLLREWLSVHPGDCVQKDQADAEAIRAHNAKWTPTHVWHFDPIYAGVNNGESGV